MRMTWLGPIVAILMFCCAANSLHAGGLDLSGRWKGEWRSNSNGHHGPMNATFERVDCKHYEVRFRGRFAKVIPFRYKATLEVTGRTSCGVQLSGSHRLGPIMGTFEYQAHATNRNFTAHYKSRNDHGTFKLAR